MSSPLSDGNANKIRTSRYSGAAFARVTCLHTREGTMANEKAVLFIGANKPIVGRDQDAINLWIETPSWLDRQMRANWFQRFDGIWLTAHGGTMNSAWLCYGERARMDEWRRSDEFE